MADEAYEKRVSDFLSELNKAIASHNCRRRWDSGLYQLLVIGAAVAGFGSLYAGTIGDSAKWAGIIGALTSVATILSQQLHCVKAVNWHDRMAVELDGIRLQLIFEKEMAPTPGELAELSKQLRDVKLSMTKKWEKIASVVPTKLGDVREKKKARQ